MTFIERESFVFDVLQPPKLRPNVFRMIVQDMRHVHESMTDVLISQKTIFQEMEALHWMRHPDGHQGYEQSQGSI